MSKEPVGEGDGRSVSGSIYTGALQGLLSPGWPRPDEALYITRTGFLILQIPRVSPAPLRHLVPRRLLPSWCV